MNGKNKPRLSVITVNYNNATGLEKTIESVSSQTYDAIEFLIIDGGSKDGSKEIIEKHKAKLHYWVSEPDKGIYHAMNKGIIAATGEYCLFLNSGDVFFDQYTVENALHVIDNEDIIYGNAVKIKPHYKRLIKYSPKLTLYDFIKIEPALHHQASFIKKELFDKYGLYDESIKIIADWEFFFRTIILNRAKTKYIDQTICVFEGTGLSNSLPLGNKIRIEANLRRDSILKMHFPDYILDDYRRLDIFLSQKSVYKKILNKISYFRFRK
ncbi:MAG: glycosyltransferase family 2 protein [Paludibacter sp.]|nr:glycosyltransferase family 2 protein [Paludibacter sp.]